MPIIAIIAFVICVILFVLLSNILANRKQMKAAYDYGKQHFDIELPKSASSKNPAFHKLSDAEAFFSLVLPYLKDLKSEKREQLIAKIEELKSDLKISHDVYDKFIQAAQDTKTQS